MLSTEPTSESTSCLEQSENPRFSLGVTDPAGRRIAELRQEEGDPDLKLRIYVTGGGCSGFQYGFAFEKVIQDDDMVIKKSLYDETGERLLEEVIVLVDYASWPYLERAEIDYEKTFKGEQFIIRNPNAKTTCGCGSSFST